MEHPAFSIARRWTQAPFDAETRAEVQHLFDTQASDEIINRFGSALVFGTAGLRGVMGAGTAMMNRYTIAKAARALADALNAHYPGAAERGVVVGFDCRRHSAHFAEVTAGVLAAAGVKVMCYDRLTPTNLVPAAVRRLGAFAGIMITSSHNPKKYNGFKAFWSNGAQIVAPVDQQVSQCMATLDESAIPCWSLEEAQAKGRLIVLGQEAIDAYVAWTVATATPRQHTDVKVVYTPLGGTGWSICQAAFAKAGFTQVQVVAEEREPGPDFAGLDAPNPEVRETWTRALALATQTGADIVLANDGDADRLGVAVPTPGGDYQILTGNQIGAAMLTYLIQALPPEQVNPKTFAICSVVSSPLTRAICEVFGISFQETLTGFKWMGNAAEARVQRGEHFLFAYEEAFGFTFGDSRDKDGVTAVLLWAEIAAWCKDRGIAVLDFLTEIYARAGVHLEGAAERYYEGHTGQDTMAAILAKLRQTPPTSIAGQAVVKVRDLLQRRVTINGECQPDTALPPQDMLSFTMADGSWIAIRPSGTEPKIKAYVGVVMPPMGQAAVAAALADASGALQALVDAASVMLAA